MAEYIVHAAEPYQFGFEAESTALIIIDMQSDFVNPGGFGEMLGNDVSQLSRAVEPTKAVLAAFRGKGMRVIHTREGHRPDLSDCPPTKIARGNLDVGIGDNGPMGRILIRGEAGHEIIEDLQPHPREPVIDKPGKGSFYATDLQRILENWGVKSLVVCGVTTEVCVHTTVREANDRGYECLVLEDCVASYFPEFQKAAIDMIKAQGGNFRLGIQLRRIDWGASGLMNNSGAVSEAVAGLLPGRDGVPQVVYRIVGDSYLLVEYGEMILDLNLRIRVYSLQQHLERQKIKGLLEMAPGVRSVLIKYDPLRLSLRKLLGILKKSESELPASETLSVPSRIVHLPLAFHERWTLEAIEKYMQSIRPEAPYLPDNVEFVARCNGFDGPDAVLQALLTGYKMVMGLGDVYLGAPCAVPLDPLTRVVVPKYNPARTFTPEGAVGIGGSYICIYPMESPGGYQLVGRTLPIWNTYQTTPDFGGAPWLLRIFDRIQFELVGEKELEESREAMFGGSYRLRLEEGAFDMSEYNRGLEPLRDQIEQFKVRQRDAAARWTEGY